MLSNKDFRRLAEEDPEQFGRVERDRKQRAAHEDERRSVKGGETAGPTSRRHEGRLETGRGNQEVNAYIDRAAERRALEAEAKKRGGGGNYHFGDINVQPRGEAEISAVSLSAVLAGVAGGGQTNKYVLTAEESKFVGGDADHTHLVKGLDHMMLERRRREIEESHQEQQQQSSYRLRETETAASNSRGVDDVHDNDDLDEANFREMGQNYFLNMLNPHSIRFHENLEKVDRILQTGAKFKDSKQQFKKGRMLYVYAVGRNTILNEICRVPTVVISGGSNSEDDDRSFVTYLPQELMDLVASFVDRQGNEDNKAVIELPENTIEEQKKANVEAEKEDDIFGDVGEYDATQYLEKARADLKIVNQKDDHEEDEEKDKEEEEEEEDASPEQHETPAITREETPSVNEQNKFSLEAGSLIPLLAKLKNPKRQFRAQKKQPDLSHLGNKERSQRWSPWWGKDIRYELAPKVKERDAVEKDGRAMSSITAAMGTQLVPSKPPEDIDEDEPIDTFDIDQLYLNEAEDVDHTSREERQRRWYTNKITEKLGGKEKANPEAVERAVDRAMTKLQTRDRSGKQLAEVEKLIEKRKREGGTTSGGDQRRQRLE